MHAFALSYSLQVHNKIVRKHTSAKIVCAFFNSKIILTRESLEYGLQKKSSVQPLCERNHSFGLFNKAICPQLQEMKISSKINSRF